MVALIPIVKKGYWLLAGLGGLWALLLACSIHPTFQRHLIYMHKLHHGHFQNVTNPEEFGFAKGQVTPFWLDASDGERLFCWHVLPLDVYHDNELEIANAGGLGVADDFESTVGAKLLRKDAKSRLVINFHGNAGHVAMGWRPSVYRSMVGIPHTHTIACDYRGFGLSSLKNAPHVPSETGLITDGISIVSYALNVLKQPPSRIVLLGQSLGTAVTAATSLYFTEPGSPLLPSDIVAPVPAPKTPQAFAGVILAAGFTDMSLLLRTYKIKGIVPILAPLGAYPKIANFLDSKVLDRWPTLERLKAVITAASQSSTPLHLSILHARNDQEIPFPMAETLYGPLETIVLAEDGATSVAERRSIEGGERVRRGAFAYRAAETSDGERSVEVEVVRYGGHSEGVGWGQVGLAVRRAFKKKTFRPGLDVE